MVLLFSSLNPKCLSFPLRKGVLISYYGSLREAIPQCALFLWGRRMQTVFCSTIIKDATSLPLSDIVISPLVKNSLTPPSVTSTTSQLATGNWLRYLPISEVQPHLHLQQLFSTTGRFFRIGVCVGHQSSTVVQRHFLVEHSCCSDASYC